MTYISPQSVKQKLSYELFYYFMGLPNHMLIRSKPQVVPHKVINRGDFKLICTLSQVIYDLRPLFCFIHFYVLDHTGTSRGAHAKGRDHKCDHTSDLGDLK